MLTGRSWHCCEGSAASVLLGGTSVALLRCWRSSLITALIRLALLCSWDSVYNFRFPGCRSWTLKSHYDLMLQVSFPGLGEHLHVSVSCVLFYWTDVLCNYWKALFFLGIYVICVWYGHYFIKRFHIKCFDMGLPVEIHTHTHTGKSSSDNLSVPPSLSILPLSLHTPLFLHVWFRNVWAALRRQKDALNGRSE